MERIILHIDMDAFFAQVEERENPQFKEKPIVVGADPKRGRGVVATCNYKAREYGIHSAMPITKAFKLCPEAVFLPPSFEMYEKTSRSIFETVKSFSDKSEIVSLDEAYLDLSFLISDSLDKGYAKAEKLARKLKKEIFKKERLTSTVGIGPNKLIAKIASQRAKPDGLLMVKLREAEKFLEPLDIKEIPGIGVKTAEKLNKLGIKKIKELKTFSKEKLVALFGKAGEWFYYKARAIDPEEVRDDYMIKSIGKEHTFLKDTNDPDIIFGIFDKMINGVFDELSSQRFYFKTITIVFRSSDFQTHTKSRTLNNFTNRLILLKRESKKLLLRFLVEKPKLVRLVGLRVSNFK